MAFLKREEDRISRCWQIKGTSSNFGKVHLEETWIRAENNCLWIYPITKNTTLSASSWPQTLFFISRAVITEGIFLSWRPWSKRILGPQLVHVTDLPRSCERHSALLKNWQSSPGNPDLNSAKFIKSNKIQRKCYRNNELIFSLKLPGRSTRNVVRSLCGICRPLLRDQHHLLQNRKMWWFIHMNTVSELHLYLPKILLPSQLSEDLACCMPWIMVWSYQIFRVK